MTNYDPPILEKIKCESEVCEVDIRIMSDDSSTADIALHRNSKAEGRTGGPI